MDRKHKRPEWESHVAAQGAHGWTAGNTAKYRWMLVSLAVGGIAVGVWSMSWFRKKPEVGPVHVNTDYLFAPDLLEEHLAKRKPPIRSTPDGFNKRSQIARSLFYQRQLVRSLRMRQCTSIRFNEMTEMEKHAMQEVLSRYASASQADNVEGIELTDEAEIGWRVDVGGALTLDCNVPGVAQFSFGGIDP